MRAVHDRRNGAFALIADSGVTTWVDELTPDMLEDGRPPGDSEDGPAWSGLAGAGAPVSVGRST